MMGFLLSRTGAAVVGIVVALGLLTFSHRFAYQAGRQVEQAAFLDRINKENEDAGNSAEDWRAQYRRCVDAGRLFDFEAGSCHQ